MRDFNIAFSEALANPSSEFRFTLEVALDKEATDFVYFTSHGDGVFPGGATAIENVIADISSTSQKLNNRYARAEIGGLTFKLADIDNAVTLQLYNKFINNISFIRRQVVIYGGFYGLDWVDYEPLDTYYIDNISNTGSGYIFNCTDIQKETRKKIFELDESTLANSISDDDMEIPLTLSSTTGKFLTVQHDGNYTDRPNEVVGYVKIDDEVIAHSGFVGTSLQVLQRGAMNTLAVSHESDENADSDRRKKVTEHVYLEGSVAEITHLVLCGESIDEARVIPSGWHSGISIDFIKTDTFVTIGSDIYNATDGSGVMRRFEGEKSQDAKQFIETQLLQSANLFMSIDSHGAYGLRRHTKISQNAAVALQLDSNIIKSQGLSDLQYDADQMANFLVMNWNWNDKQKRTTRKSVFVDGSSMQRHMTVKKETLTFRGVHTRIHTDEQNKLIFDTFADLWSNPPYVTTVSCNKMALAIEAGDNVGVSTHMLKDFVDGAEAFNRAMGVTQRDINYRTGEVRLSLVGSSQPSGIIFDEANSGSAYQLNDSWYSSEGADIQSLPGVGAGSISSGITINGHADANNAAAIYYHLGDLTLNAGIDALYTENVQLRVRGHLTINGKIGGKGRGLTGTLGTYTALEGNYGKPGYLGTTKPGSGLLVGATDSINPDEQHSARDYSFSTNGVPSITGPVKDTPIIGSVDSLPNYSITNTDGVLRGLPSDLRGSSGSAGMPTSATTGPTLPGTGDTVRGGDGGNGGAGLIIICRGISFGASGSIDSSGGDGAPGNFIDVTGNGASGRYYAGAGAGGAPGGVLIIIDGDHTPPSLTNNHLGNLGESPGQGTAISNAFPFLEMVTPIPAPGGYSSSGEGRGFHGRPYGEAANRVQYVPVLNAPEEEQSPTNRKLAKVVGVSVVSGAQHIIIHGNGSISERALVTWSSLNDEALTGYQIQARRTGDPDWINQSFVTASSDNAAYFDVEDGVSYDVRIRAFGVAVQAGDWSDTEVHVAIGASALTPIDAPAGVSIVSGTSELLQQNDGAIIERMLVTWDASIDPLFTGTEIEFKEDTDTLWKVAALINSRNVTKLHITGTGGTLYNIRLRHLSRTRPVSAYASFNHTLIGKSQPPSDVPLFTASQNGEVINLFWELISDIDRNGYTIRYGVVGVQWKDATPLTEETRGTKITTAYIPPGTWDLLIKAIDRTGNVSINAARTTLTVISNYNVISAVEQSPEWPGILTGYIKHYTGVLIPDSQNLAGDDEWDTFDLCVPNPVAQSSYESPEQTTGIDIDARVWADINSQLCVDESGIADPKLSVDHKLGAGSYDGFEPWSISQIKTQDVKFKLTNDNARGLAKIVGFKTTLDAIERTERQSNVTVSPGGTAVTFNQPYANTPFIKTFTQNEVGLISDSASDAPTGFVFHIYNSSGTSVGGTGRFEAIGV